jgi:hypothetical protein
MALNALEMLMAHIADLRAGFWALNPIVTWVTIVKFFLKPEGMLCFKAVKRTSVNF